MAERKRRGLGRGLGALINSDAAEEAAAAEQAAADEAAAAESAQAARAEQLSAGTGSAPEGSASTGSAGAGSAHGGSETVAESAESWDSTSQKARRGRHDYSRAPESTDGADPRAGSRQVSRETGGNRAPAPRPIDVFFSAKSDLDRQVIARESATIARPSTSSRRSPGGQRAPMPDVLSRGAARSSATAAGHAPAGSNALSLEDESGTDQATKGSLGASDPTEAAWTETVSRETGGSVDGAEFRSIPVDAIVPNPRQPRQEFDEEHMDELIHSIREIGVLQPIVVRPAGPDQYELVMGERRWRASKTAERTSIPAIVRMTTDDDLLRDALLENIHRSQLNPLEEAAAYRQLLDDFNCTQDELAERIGRSRPQISNTLRLMKLPPAVQRRVAAGVLSAGHARALLGLKSQEQMDQLAGRIVAEGLSVRATEEAVTLAQRDQNTGDLGRERAKSPRVRQLEEFSDALTDRLDTQVKITLGAKKVRIAIDFGSIDDLHRLMDMIGSRP